MNKQFAQEEIQGIVSIWKGWSPVVKTRTLKNQDVLWGPISKNKNTGEMRNATRDTGALLVGCELMHIFWRGDLTICTNIFKCAYSSIHQSTSKQVP